MRIIDQDGQHDYYDCIQDPSDHENLFIRKREQIPLNKGRVYHWSESGFLRFWNKDDYYIEEIGFCGEIYSFYIWKDSIYWTWEELKPLWEIYLLKLNNYATRSYFKEKNRKKKRQKLENKYDARYQEKLNYFRKYKCAYFHLTRKTITINPILKNFKFYKIFPSAQAYQEIERYLFGVIAERREHVPTVSDKDLIQSKGFNLKTSFRKGKK